LCFVGRRAAIVVLASWGCESAPDAASSRSVPAWQDEVQSRRAEIDKVIADNRGSFDAFGSGSLGDATLEMIPFVVFRVLQEIEPADACRKIHVQNGRNTPESATTSSSVIVCRRRQNSAPGQRPSML
jgi:hypothetical protein